MNIPVVYDDNWLLVADKPSGLLTVPTPRNEKRTLTSILNEDALTKGMTYKLYPCHRLDRDTSGLIIYAKGKAVRNKIMDEFKQRKVKKTYLVFVRGNLLRKRGEIKKRIEGLAAVTHYRVIGERKDYSIVEVIPLTGRTNQIRIHFASIGHPILGEDRFAFRRDFKLRAKRLCLHAQDLEFKHPINGNILRLHTELPQELQEFLHHH